MEFDKFINDYWEVLVKHICNFYPLDLDFISEFSEDLDWNEMRYNPSIEWTNELVDLTPDHYPGIKFTKDLNSIGFPERPTKELTDEQFANLSLALTSKKIRINVYKNLYENFILKFIQGNSLAELFRTRLNYVEKFYHLRPIETDKTGHLMKYSIFPSTITLLNQGVRTLSDLPNELELKETSYLGDGIPRIKEIALAPNLPFASLVVSENIKLLLETTKLPEHRFTPLKMTSNKVSSNLDYYLFSLERDSLLRIADFENLNFYYYKYINDKWDVQKNYLDKGEITSFESILEFKQRHEITNDIIPTKYDVSTDIDVFSVKNAIIINKKTKSLLENHLEGNFWLESAQLHQIKLNQQDKINDTYTKNFFKLKPMRLEVDRELQFYFDKMERLLSQPKKMTADLKQDEFLDIQIKLEVIIPEVVKEKLRIFKNKERPHFNLSYEEYEELQHQGIEIQDDNLELYDINNFYLETEYASTDPRTHKSLIIGSFGNGDLIGLLLEKHDDFRLQEEFLFFDHEVAEIHPYPDTFRHFRK